MRLQDADEEQLEAALAARKVRRKIENSITVDETKRCKVCDRTAPNTLDFDTITDEDNVWCLTLCDDCLRMAHEAMCAATGTLIVPSPAQNPYPSAVTESLAATDAESPLKPPVASPEYSGIGEYGD